MLCNQRLLGAPQTMNTASKFVGGVAGTAAVASTAAYLCGCCSYCCPSFNPAYNKQDQRRMQYILSKYAEVYGLSGRIYEEPNQAVQEIDADSKLLMTEDMKKPANPFRNIHDYDHSLMLTRLHTRAGGHNGRFLATHAMPAIGAIIEFQLKRSGKTWIPGYSAHGQPNDYINMFFHEMKVWLRLKMTADGVSIMELRKRSEFLRKLKNDQFYWCFPCDKTNMVATGPLDSGNDLHSTINYVHERVKDALKVLEREKKNSSLQELFITLNNHSANLIGFGKHFIIFLLSNSVEASVDFPTIVLEGGEDQWPRGQTYEQGKLVRKLQDDSMLTKMLDGKHKDEKSEAEKKKEKQILARMSVADRKEMAKEEQAEQHRSYFMNLWEEHKQFEDMLNFSRLVKSKTFASQHEHRELRVRYTVLCCVDNEYDI